MAVAVEVAVHRESRAGAALVQAAAKELRIWQQVGHAGDGGQPVDEPAGIDDVEVQLRGRAQRRAEHRAARRLIWSLDFSPVSARKRVEFFGHQFEQCRMERVLKNEVRERYCAHQLFAQPFALSGCKERWVDEFPTRQAHAPDADEVGRRKTERLR